MPTPSPSTTLPATPPIDADQIKRYLDSEMRLGSRLLYVGLLLFSLAGAGTVGSLLLTETSLPGRTRLAFGVLLALCLAWSCLFVWILARRRVLFARHRVAAGRLAVVGSSAFAVASLIALVSTSGAPAALGAVATALLLTALASLFLFQARRHQQALELLRTTLERARGEGAQVARSAPH